MDNQPNLQFPNLKTLYYSPPDKSEPIILPDYWRESANSPARTDLNDLTDAELSELGWKGPIQTPPLPGTSYFTHDYQWNKSTREYDATEISEYDKQKRVNYQEFWDLLVNGLPFMNPDGSPMEGTAYETIRVASSQSLSINTIVTEFIALLGDAKSGKANVKRIQKILSEIISNISFSELELKEIERCFIKSGMFAVYTLE